MVATSSSSSQPQSAAYPWPSYHHFLYSLAQRQPHSAQLWFTTQDWREPTFDYPTKTNIPCGAVFFLEHVRNCFQIVFQGGVSLSGSIYPESVQGFLANHYNARTTDSPKVRVLLHGYYLVHGQTRTSRYGMNNTLLLKLGQQHQIDPHMFIHHYRPSRLDPSPETLPSLRKVLKFETDKLLFTACVCTELQDEFPKTLLVLCGEKAAREHEEELTWRTGDQHALSRMYLEEGPLAFPQGLQHHSLQYLNALQSSAFSDSTVLESNPFEALLPLLRISIATEIDYVNTAIQVWYEKKGLMETVTTYPGLTIPPSAINTASCANAGEEPSEHTTSNLEAHSSTPSAILDPLLVEQSIVTASMKPSEAILKALKQLDRRRHKAFELLQSLKCFFPSSAGSSTPHPIVTDALFLIQKQNMVAEFLRDSISIQASENSLEEARASITQSHSVARISTVGLIFTLAFIPMSLVTSIFGMNVNILTSDGTKWWNVLYAVVVVYIITLAMAACLYPDKAKDLLRWRPNIGNLRVTLRKLIMSRIRVGDVGGKKAKGNGKGKGKEKQADDATGGQSYDTSAAYPAPLPPFVPPPSPLQRTWSLTIPRPPPPPPPPPPCPDPAVVSTSEPAHRPTSIRATRSTPTLAQRPLKSSSQSI